MENELCPKTEKCPLFKGTMLASKKAQEIYMNLYCKAGVAGRMACKRFLVASMNVSPPPDLMPDDQRSPEEIVAAMEV